MCRYQIYDGEMKIKLYQDEVDSFMAKAYDKAQKYLKLAHDKSPYGFNHPHSHLVGLVAEYASLLLFQNIEEVLNINLHIDPVFQDNTRDSECDIIVHGTRIEVKSIKYGAWLNYGPCISIKQLPKIKKKADVILWALYNEKKREVTFKGFNKIQDIYKVPKLLTGPEGKQIINYKVQDILINLNELVL